MLEPCADAMLGPCPATALAGHDNPQTAIPVHHMHEQSIFNWSASEVHAGCNSCSKLCSRQGLTGWITPLKEQASTYKLELEAPGAANSAVGPTCRGCRAPEMRRAAH